MTGSTPWARSASSDFIHQNDGGRKGVYRPGFIGYLGKNQSGVGRYLVAWQESLRFDGDPGLIYGYTADFKTVRRDPRGHVRWEGCDGPISAWREGDRLYLFVGKFVGEIFDHHAVEFEYADGSRLYSFCCHIPGCWSHFGAYAHGTKGHAQAGEVVAVDGQEAIRFAPGRDGHQVEHDDLFAALLAGEPFNEGDYGATSTMTAILGRMATYSGKVVTWEEALSSSLDLSPKRYAWDAPAPVLPDENGVYPCAMPGVTKAW